jgi:hypothetical protein
VEGSVPIPVFQLARTISFLESKWSGRDDCLPKEERLAQLRAGTPCCCEDLRRKTRHPSDVGLRLCELPKVAPLVASDHREYSLDRAR